MTVKGPLPLSRWLWRSYLRSALVPLLLVELSFVVIYFVTTNVVYERGAETMRGMATDALADAAEREASVIARRLETISALTRVYGAEAARALASDADASAAEKARHAMSADGVFHTTADTGGSAVFYSGIVPIGEAERQKVWRTVQLDPIMKSIVETDPLIRQVYLNTQDSLNRIFPYFDVMSVYPPKMDIPSYNFYYEADAAHNPGRRAVWTDAYVDPAGAGWMVSSIAPVYGGDRLEGVVGIDVTIGTIVEQILNLKLEGDGYAVLIGRDGTILALPPAGEADWGVSELIDHSYNEAIRQDTFKPDGFNIFRRAELAPLAQALNETPRGRKSLNFGSPMIAAWSTVPGPNWTLVVMASESAVLAEATALREQLAFVTKGMLAILILFYAGFFLFLWRRSVAMSRRVAQPLAAIEANMVRISDGGQISDNPSYEIAELQTVGDHLVRMGIGLQAANRSKAAFLSAMSHEFRTPLNAITGFSDLLLGAKGEVLDADKIRQVEAISDAGRQMLHLVEGVIDLARIEQGSVSHSLGAVDALAVVRRAVAAESEAAHRRHLTLSIAEPPLPLPTLRGDGDILTRILAHLISNAVKYNRDGGRVTLGFDVTPESVAVTVSDTGHGIAPDRQARLFQPFDRLGQENSTIGGAGIGLALSRRLAEQIGCRITLDHSTAQGSRFSLHVPVMTQAR
ncbi:MAG: ATPase [Bradyrhizobium sp. PARBB1]|nr:MAG: ATPase [Bradyrhizobium sp. PARBB1]